jgi:hypothetical protein
LTFLKTLTIKLCSTQADIARMQSYFQADKRSAIMKRGMTWVLLGVLMLAAQAAWGGFSGHVLPQGDVLIYEQGKPQARFHQEFPLPEGSLIACNGSCLVRINKISLLANDKSRFALSEGQEGWILLVEQGKVNFSLAPGSPVLIFHTPDHVLVARRGITPAATDSTVEGVIEVVEGKTTLTLSQGQLQVGINGEEQLLQAGNHIQLAQLPTGVPEEAPPVPAPVASTVPADTGPGAGTYAGIGFGMAGVGFGVAMIVDDDDDDEGSAF